DDDDEVDVDVVVCEPSWPSTEPQQQQEQEQLFPQDPSPAHRLVTSSLPPEYYQQPSEPFVVVAEPDGSLFDIDPSPSPPPQPQPQIQRERERGREEGLGHREIMKRRQRALL